MKINTIINACQDKRTKTFFFICIFLSFLLKIDVVQASTVYCQAKSFTFKMEQKTVQEVIDYLESKSEFVFLFYEGIMGTQQKVSLSVKDGNIYEVMDRLLENTSISYEIKDRQIVLKPKEKSTVSASAQGTSQQRKKVTGTVLNEQGESLPGVAIQVVGTPRGVTTDIDGTFSIEVTSADKLLFSFLGMQDETVDVKNQTQIVVKMKSQADLLDEVTVVAFAKQKKESVIGSISTVKPSELKVPSSNLTTALAGRVAGLISYQRSGEPGKDNADFFIRGVTTFGYKADPLILIDGVEVTSSELARLQPDDIASFSIMKDATSSALYGARGANGVILVTTKEGKEGKLNVSVRFEESFSTPTRSIDIADPITYMLKHNEAVTTRNPLAAQPYSQEKVDNTIAGVNPYIYPAVDWYNMLFKDMTNNHRFNMSLSGGGKVARYYVALTYNKDNGILKVDNRNNFNSNINLNRIGVRSNINLNLTKTTEMAIRVNADFDDYSGPIDGGEGMFKKVMRANPVLYPAYYQPDEKNMQAKHILFGNTPTANYVNPYADMVKGYKEYSKTIVVAQAEIKQNLDFLTKGLNLRIMANTQRNSYFDVTRAYNPYFYIIDRYDRKTQTYTLRNVNENSATEWLNYNEGAKIVDSSFYLETAAEYNRTFNEKHDVGGLLVYTMKTSLTGNAGNLIKSLPYRNLGLAGRFTYGYDGRYFIEGNFGYNGSERFSKNHRFGFFPSVGLGWMVSNEKFFKPLSKVVTQLKLKGTYGMVGNDAIGSPDDRFFYLSQVEQGKSSAPGFGLNFDQPLNRPITTILRYANDNITWEIAKKLNLSIEATIMNDLNIQAEYFRENRSKILMDRAAIVPEIGLEAAVRANIGEAFAHGFDMSMDYNKYFNNGFWLTGRFNFTYSTSEFRKYEEPAYSDAPWRSHVGHSLAQTWGYIGERLFIDQADIDNSPKQFGEYMPGDIKYRDINRDGIINENDQVPIGLPTSPEIVYGFGLSAGWKGIDFSFFFQGLGRESFWIDQWQTAPFIDTDGDPNWVSNNALLRVYADNHWSETNQNPYALWPRLSNTLVDNNNRTSTWFMRNGSFIRLKQVELGYTLPEKWMRKIYVSNLRLYLSGTNLLTFSKFKLWDPEMAGNGLGYPIQKTYNIGLQLSF